VAFEPAYVETYRSGELARRVVEGLRVLESCTVCPRSCRVDRLADQRRLCHTGRHARVASCFPHFGEEDCLRGWRGSGTIFFSWCNLRCVFCQNWETSQQGVGRDVDAAALAAMMLALQHAGCHNVNLVTPEHVVPLVLEALPIAIEGGLRLPLVYNTSSYDSLHSLQLLDGVVDVYMPDFKVWDPSTAARWLGAKDYPEVARAAIAEMHRQVGDLRLDDGLAVRGVLVRHLVMPGALDDTTAILGWLAETLGPDTYVNVMDQYRPDWRVVREPGRWPSLERRISRDERGRALSAARAVGLRRLDSRAPPLRQRVPLPVF
jgi:putative pyruvate formate lyase activating enzyme